MQVISKAFGLHLLWFPFQEFLKDNHVLFANGGRKEKILQRKPRRATMSSRRLSNAKRIINLIPILKSNLVLVDCWPESHPNLVNVAERMGELKLIEGYILLISLLTWCLLPLFAMTFLVRYTLEGKELEFYMKKIQRKKGKGRDGAA